MKINKQAKIGFLFLGIFLALVGCFFLLSLNVNAVVIGASTTCASLTSSSACQAATNSFGSSNVCTWSNGKCSEVKYVNGGSSGSSSGANSAKSSPKKSRAPAKPNQNQQKGVNPVPNLAPNTAYCGSVSSNLLCSSVSSDKCATTFFQQINENGKPKNPFSGVLCKLPTADEACAPASQAVYVSGDPITSCDQVEVDECSSKYVVGNEDGSDKYTKCKLETGDTTCNGNIDGTPCSEVFNKEECEKVSSQTFDGEDYNCKWTPSSTSGGGSSSITYESKSCDSYNNDGKSVCEAHGVISSVVNYSCKWVGADFISGSRGHCTDLTLAPNGNCGEISDLNNCGNYKDSNNNVCGYTSGTPCPSSDATSGCSSLTQDLCSSYYETYLGFSRVCSWSSGGDGSSGACFGTSVDSCESQTINGPLDCSAGLYQISGESGNYCAWDSSSCGGKVPVDSCQGVLQGLDDGNYANEICGNHYNQNTGQLCEAYLGGDSFYYCQESGSSCGGCTASGSSCGSGGSTGTCETGGECGPRCISTNNQCAGYCEISAAVPNNEGTCGIGNVCGTDVTKCVDGQACNTDCQDGAVCGICPSGSTAKNIVQGDKKYSAKWACSSSEACTASGNNFWSAKNSCSNPQQFCCAIKGTEIKGGRGAAGGAKTSGASRTSKIPSNPITNIGGGVTNSGNIGDSSHYSCSGPDSNGLYSCNLVAGSGKSVCSADYQCSPSKTFAACSNDGSCSLVKKTSTNLGNNQCIPGVVGSCTPNSHCDYSSGSGKCVSGAPENGGVSCLSDKSCGSNSDFHYVLDSNGLCVVADGPGEDECDPFGPLGGQCSVGASHSCSSSSQIILKMFSPWSSTVSAWNSNTIIKELKLTYSGASDGLGTGIIGQPCNQTTPEGYSLMSIDCLYNNSAGCASQLCSWSKDSTSVLSYRISLARTTSDSVSANCGSDSRGDNLVSRICVLNSSASHCSAELCLWSNASSDARFYITQSTEAGSGVYADCASTTQLADDYKLEQSVCLKQNMSANPVGIDDDCLADICLWSLPLNNRYEICYDDVFGTPFVETGTNVFHPITCNKPLFWINDSSGSVVSAVKTENFSTPVCYGDLNCSIRDNSCNYNEENVLSLYKTSGASYVADPGWNQQGLVNFWNFDNNSLDVVGASDAVNAYRGVNVSYSQGLVGYAANFTKRGYFKIPNQDNHKNDANTELSVVVLIRKNTNFSSSQYDIVGDFVYNNGGWKFYLDKSGRVSFGKAGDKNITSSLRINDTYWHQIAVSYNKSGSEVCFYKDGELGTCYGLDLVFDFDNGGEDYSIGGSNISSELFKGSIDNLMIFNRILEEGELKCLYNSQIYEKKVCCTSNVINKGDLYPYLDLISPKCGEDFVLGQNVSIVLNTTFNQKKGFSGKLFFGDGGFISINRGITSVNHTYTTSGTMQIKANATGNGYTVSRVANIIVVNTSKEEDYVAACIAQPKDLERLEESNVYFNATTTKAFHYTPVVGGEGIKTDIKNSLRLNWTFSDKTFCVINSSTSNCSDGRGKFIFKTGSEALNPFSFTKSFANSGNNSAGLLAETQ